MQNAPESLEIIRARIERAHQRFGPPPERVELVAVSKAFDAAAIRPFLGAGQRVFGENRVQEAKEKWPELRASYDGIELAGILAEEMKRAGRRLQVFVQVNIGLEEQKAGIAPSDAAAFVGRCKDLHGLDVIGLMCIPPEGDPAGPYFAHLASLARDAGVEKLSMGMSSDFETAIAMGATHVRVGSALFGHRG